VTRRQPPVYASLHMSDTLRSRIEALVARPPGDLDPTAEAAFRALIDALNAGAVRAASRRDDGAWEVHAWVKQGILLGFRLGRMADCSSGRFPFFDKHTYPLRPASIDDGIRIVPGGSSIRTGSYVAPGVVCMPPMYVNVGAY